jgi:hypothetical protein
MTPRPWRNSRYGIRSMMRKSVSVRRKPPVTAVVVVVEPAAVRLLAIVALKTTPPRLKNNSFK